MTELSNYSSVQSHLFVRLTINGYNGGVNTVFRFSDYKEHYSINSEDYYGLGRLLNITSSLSEIRPSSGELTIALSGIPNTSLTEILNSKLKGSEVQIYRVLFDSVTGVALNIPENPFYRFKGYIDNYSLQEDYDVNARTATNTVSLICKSLIDVLQNKISGRKTNTQSEKSFYPNDLSMDRVSVLEGSQFNFGADY
jgi:hypothetical protein